MEGWIKLHKKIMEHWMWDDPVILKAWIDILLSVNYTDKKILFDGNLVTVEAGQIITSVRKLATRWKCSKERVNKILYLFEQDNMLTVNKTTRRTLLSVVNYGFYQNGSDSLKDTDKDSEQDTDKDTDSPQHKKKKEDKEIKNKYSRFVAPSVEEVRDYCSQRNNGIDAEEFVNFYQANGWVQGKGKPIKDWKACVRTWEATRKKNQGGAQTKGKALDEESIRQREEYKQSTDRIFSLLGVP